jgi:predicted kinase
VTHTPILYLIVGLPGAGKTTVATQLAAEHRALRLTPDEWMIPLFGESDAGGKRDVLEGRLIWVALRVLESGTDVVLDFGFWGRDERWSLLALADGVGARGEVVYLPVDPATQWERIESRYAATPGQTFPITRDDLLTWRTIFSEPDATELAGGPVPPPPTGWPTWLAWAQQRWPSL